MGIFDEMKDKAGEFVDQAKEKFGGQGQDQGQEAPQEEQGGPQDMQDRAQEGFDNFRDKLPGQG
ncbi:hypothetical protein EV193_101874 [Herbihabitans rhizosphaerae]|uniref:Antitoxin protein of toxin-antitoxin system n=1 Tax=Herbihabitans rhizosphaerae TaxID=1872711 RepID=A0A4Q7L7V5_9PSEU|nr:hypothetical protein [Herbihabitans rhizosphaerae]RZS44990.1 hypothetical protein EV193_101874 [Herbihabitans rhizosphaerae]